MSSFGRLSADSLSRTQGRLVGQIAGDALGSLVEFEGGAYIEHLYPG
jgi:ADP-ribosylglycohydrolase